MREAKCTGLRLQGILVETDGTGARQNLMELCARLGGPFLDVAQVKKLMLRHDGCVALKAIIQIVFLSGKSGMGAAVSIRYRFDHRSILSGSIFDEYRK